MLYLQHLSGKIFYPSIELATHYW